MQLSPHLKDMLEYKNYNKIVHNKVSKYIPQLPTIITQTAWNYLHIIKHNITQILNKLLIINYIFIHMSIRQEAKKKKCYE